MAQQQIALQQVRTGKQRDLPDALEKGQIGFSTDVGRVFIGLPSSSDPASIVAGRTWSSNPDSGKENVEIITEFTPWQVVSSIINRPFTFDLPPGPSSNQVYIKSESRVFIDYIAYDDAGTTLESGSAQMVTIETNTLLAQFNNTTRQDGVVSIVFENPMYDAQAKNMYFTLKNNDTASAYHIELVYRGWDKP